MVQLFILPERLPFISDSRDPSSCNRPNLLKYAKLAQNAEDMKGNENAIIPVPDMK